MYVSRSVKNAWMEKLFKIMAILKRYCLVGIVSWIRGMKHEICWIMNAALNPLDSIKTIFNLIKFYILLFQLFQTPHSKFHHCE